MPPFQIENAVVLQPFTGHNRIAELTVMRGGLVHYHRSRCFVADGEGDVSGSPVRKSGPRTGNPDARGVGFSAIYGSVDLSSNLP